MDSLFTEKEIQDLYRRSTWCGEERDSAEEAEWINRFRTVAGVFETEREGQMDDLFDFTEECRPDCLPFQPLFKAAVSLNRDAEGRELFLPEAFKGWMAGFTGALGSLWSTAAGEVLTELAGKMPYPPHPWLEEKAEPVIRSGEHFRQMALRYPVFARQAVTFAYDFAKHIRLVLEDLSACLPEACRSLLDREPVTKIRKIAPPGSDRHRHGRTVHVITLESGSRLVYKPHSLGIDRAFCGWLDWLTQKAGYGKFYQPKCLDTPHGGLCTFLQASPLDRAEDAGLFFRRAGFLMGTVYLLKGCDMHAENILACGAYPVVVDMETVVLPRRSLYGRLAGEQATFRVTDMCFLPMMNNLPGFRRSDTDSLTSVFVGAGRTENLPRFGEEVFRGFDFADEVCEGFQDAIRTVITNPDEAVAAAAERFTGCEVRLVLRATMNYFTVLRALGSAESLVDPQTYERVMGRIFNFGDWVSEEDRLYVANTERDAMRRLDTPFFIEVLAEDQIGEIESDLRKQDESSLRRATETIRWCLEKKTVEDGAGQPLAMVSFPEERPVFSGERNMAVLLERMAERLAASVRRQARPVIAAQPEIINGKTIQRYFVSPGSGNCKCLLDGSLGVLVALSAYLKIAPERKDIRELLERIFQKYFSNEKMLAPGLVASVPGIADGSGGLLIGSLLCYEMGTFPETLLREIIGRFETLTAQPGKIRFALSDPIYGCCGFAAAIERIPEAFRTPALQQLHGMLVENVSQDSRLKHIPHNKLVETVRQAISGEAGREVSRPVSNHTLRFGNAGKLYNYTQFCLDSGGGDLHSAESERLAALLAEAEGVLPGKTLPDGSVEVGLLHGLSGVLYSLCRYWKPEEVPPVL